MKLWRVYIILYIQYYTIIPIKYERLDNFSFDQSIINGQYFYFTNHLFLISSICSLLNFEIFSLYYFWTLKRIGKRCSVVKYIHMAMVRVL